MANSKLVSKKSNVEFSSLVTKRLQEACSVILFGCAIFVLVALISFNSTDPSYLQTTTTGEVIHNLAGVVGAWIASLVLFIFGLPAYIIPLFLIATAWAIINFKNVDLCLGITTLRIIGGIMLIISCCSLLNTISLNATKLFVTNLPGGIIGASIWNSGNHYLGSLGAKLILAVLGLAGLTIAFGLSWIKLSKMTYSNLRKPIFNLINYFLNKKAAKHRYNSFVTPILKKSRIDNNKKDLSKNLAMSFVEQDQPIIKKITNSYKNAKAEINTDANAAVKVATSNYVLPTSDLLDKPSTNSKNKRPSVEQLQVLSKELELKLQDFNVVANVVEICPGPIITRFELTLAPGTKASKITGLSTDLARALSVSSVRVVEIIAGKSVIGIELPNDYREVVNLRELFESNAYQSATSALTLALGQDIAGSPVMANLAKMPHCLVAGTTGSGKSVGINAMLMSLLFKATADDVRLILIDPKMLELAVYDAIPHLLTPVVTDMQDAAHSLTWCVAEMERRYKLMASMGVRNISGFNTKVNSEQILDPFWEPKISDSEKDRPYLQKLPFIVVVIDEFADMIMVVGKKVEELIARIAQKARAAGIHLILATQRPSVDVITGLIKANVPTRIAFQVSSKIDSRTILDQQGAEQLLGHGDMLYLPTGSSVPVRVHGAFVSDAEVHRAVAALKATGKPNYIEELINKTSVNSNISEFLENAEADPLYDEAVSLVISSRKASASNLQRRFSIGYNRAARLIEAMEEAGIVSQLQGKQNREVLVPQEQSHE